MIDSPGNVSDKGASFFSLRYKMLFGFGLVFWAVYCLLVLVWMFGLPFTGYHGLLGQEEQRAFKQLEMVAELKKERLELRLNEQKIDTTALAHSQLAWAFKDIVTLEQRAATNGLTQGRAREIIVERLWQAMELYPYQRIDAVDAKTGLAIVSTEDTSTDFSRWHSFKNALERPNEASISFERHRASGRPCLIVSHAIADLSVKAPAEPMIYGVLLVHIDAEDVLKPLLYTGGGLGETGDVVLVDNDSRILISLKYPLIDGSTAEVLEYKMVEAPAMLAAQGQEGIISADDYRGVPVLAAYRGIKVGPQQTWGLVVKRDRKEVFAPVRNILYQAGIAAIFGMGLGGVLVLFIAGRISRPIEELDRAAAEIENGNLAVRAPIDGRDEMARLSATFNSMVGRIQNWHQDLREQVNLRTAQLTETNVALEAEIQRRAETEASLMHANRALNLFSHCNQTLVRAQDEQALMEEICRVVSSEGGYAAARIFREDRDEAAQICAATGSTLLNTTLDETVLKAVKQALDTNDTVMVETEDTIGPGNQSPLSVRGTWLVLPIPGQDSARTVLAVLTTQDKGFAQSEEQLLQELTLDIAYGISSMRMGKQLAESEMRFRTLFDHAGDSIFILDLDGKDPGAIVMANRTAADQHGYSLEEFGNLTIMDLDTPESAERAPTILKRLHGGEIVTTTAYHRRKDGSIFPVEINARIIELGGHKYVFAIDRDISEREQSQAALRESEERARIIIDSSPVGIRVMQDRRYAYANPAFVRMFGYDDTSQIIGLSWEALYAPESRPALLRKLADIEAGREVAPHYEAIGVKADGRTFDIEVWTSRVSYQGKPASLAFVLDISEAKSLRSQLIHAQKMEAIGTLAGGIAHDFNNLLTVILGFGEILMAEKGPDDPERQDLERVVHAARNGADLVRTLLMFSRKIEPALRPVNLNHLMDHVRRMLSRVVPKMISIELRLAERVAAVNADPAQIEQVMVNLAVNARDAMPEGGVFTIETRNVVLDEEYCSRHLGVTPGKYVMMEISDTGHGMDPNTLTRVFEPFFTTKESGRGTGLGLAMVYGIVKQHQGHITCESELGKGTTFRVHLPVLSGSDTGAEKESHDITVLPRGTETVLVIDDEEHIRVLSAKLLRGAGYTVLTAANGREGLDIFNRERERIGLVILDVIMPVMGGKQCLNELLATAPDAKVIIASGYTAEGPAAAITDSGAKGHLRKPYNMKSLLETVRSVLDEK